MKRLLSCILIGSLIVGLPVLTKADNETEQNIVLEMETEEILSGEQTTDSDDVESVSDADDVSEGDTVDISGEDQENPEDETEDAGAGDDSEEDDELELMSNVSVIEEEISLLYDDRCDFNEILTQMGYAGLHYEGMQDEKVTSHKVANGAMQSEYDDHVLTFSTTDGYQAIATGIGEVTLVYSNAIMEVAAEGEPDAEVIEDSEEVEIDRTNENTSIQIHVTVETAPLTVMLMAGQSNMAGICENKLVSECSKAVICEEGTVYSTYTTIYENDFLTGIQFPYKCTENNAAEFVAGALGNTTRSVTGKTLVYPLNTLTGQGTGKTGMDAALAFRWNQLTGDKVWVVNTAWNGTSIAEWHDGGYAACRSNAVYDLAMQTYRAELQSGHYRQSHMFMYWLQGESNYTMKPSAYLSHFRKVLDEFNSRYQPEMIGLISVRSSVGSQTKQDDLSMTGPRAVQYGVCRSTNAAYANVYMVSNANENWISDAGVASYFATRYPSGKFPYKTRGGSVALPKTVAEIHPGIHYLQMGHNENGITAAEGTYAVIYGSGKALSAKGFLDGNGQWINEITIPADGCAIAVPVLTPCYQTRGVQVVSEDAGIATYDADTGMITAVTKGITRILVKNGQQTIGTLTVQVGESGDYSAFVGSDYTGVYNDPKNQNYIYLTKGHLDTSYNGIAQYNGHFLLLTNGYGRNEYTGLYKYNNTWWYIENGKVNMTYEGLCKYNGSWFYVCSGRLDRTFTGIVQYNNTWFFVKSGKWDNTVSGQYTINGVTWNISKGKAVK